ncbi:hypothetical protein Tco_1176832 [Tanacetum coccineum]
MSRDSYRELRKKLEIVQKEKDGIQLNVDKFEHASKSLNKLIECQIVDNYKKGLGYKSYNVVPPPYTGNFMPPTPDLSFTGLDDFVNEPVVENCKTMSYEEIGDKSQSTNWITRYKIELIIDAQSVARTPQQNRVAKRRNRTLIEVPRTMIADTKVVIFWVEAVNPAC